MPARRMDGITSFIVMDILERALELEAAGRSIIHLEVGEPDLDPPRAVVDEMVRAMTRGDTHYTHSLGILPLREELARYYERHYHVSVDPERIVITVGTSGGFAMLFGVLLDIGDPIIITDPGYPCYPNFARYVGATPVPVPITGQQGFVLDPKALPQVPKGTPILISSPANPTGVITPREVYQELFARDLTVISDEIYHGLVYSDDQEFTALELDDDAIIVNGFSKRYAMTGLRLGWMVLPRDLVRPINRLAQNLFICPPAPSQWGALAALRQGDDWVEETRREYRERRDLLRGILLDLGFSLPAGGQGAFYLFADIEKFGMDSFEFCRRLLEEAGVAATPGRDFGENGTGRFVRFAYTNCKQRIQAAGDRMGTWLQGIRAR